MNTARVKDFSLILTSLLTQYDQKESLREMKRGGRPNIYRLGHLLKAAQETEDVAKHVGIWERSDGQAIADYRYLLQQHFIFERGQFALSPLRQLDKQMGAWVAGGKLPKYGKLKTNPDDTCNLNAVVLRHARSEHGTITPGMRIGHRVVTVVGTHTIQYKTDDGYTGSAQIPFIDPMTGESLPSHRRALIEVGEDPNDWIKKRLAANPLPSISAPMVALFGALVAGTVYLFTRKAKAEEKPKPTPLIPKEAICLVTTEQLFKWGGLNKLVVLHLHELTQAPELPTLQQTFPDTKGATPASVVVVLKDGSFWTYAEAKPVAAPELRKKYCESQK